jgi:hypothetical protein
MVLFPCDLDGGTGRGVATADVGKQTIYGVRLAPAIDYPIAERLAVRSQSTDGRETGLGAFAFRLEKEDGTSADPPTLKTAVPSWRPGDTIPLGRSRTLRVVAIRDDDANQAPVLVVEDSSQTSTDERVAQAEIGTTSRAGDGGALCNRSYYGAGGKSRASLEPLEAIRLPFEPRAITIRPTRAGQDINLSLGHSPLLLAECHCSPMPQRSRDLLRRLLPCKATHEGRYRSIFATKPPTS